ncbi:hypothetical protein KC865_01025 [Candidatus Kaiserbacteria bacterium]|nr:hypothetical protein [Candidatus Kaiserbacteria bacterium]USN92560.1 MAG: hypothetical protein H6782_01960 [Candidatus Nomurabacteria bacterium]
MKRPVFIIIGAILVLVLLVIWVYMLFFNKPSGGEDEFANLNFNNTNDPTAIVDQPENNEPTVDVMGKERLRQLTTKPTAGYREVQRTPSSTPELLYIESGTGHIFSIDLASGEEKRISATTIPLSTKGEITPDGKFVMIQSGFGAGSEFVVGEINPSDNTLSNKGLNEQIVSFSATDNNTFLYSIQTIDSVIAKEYDPLKETQKTLFVAPFREALIDWGDSASAVHYFYPKATSKLEGFLYKVENGKISRLPIDGYGLSAEGGGANVIYSKDMVGKYQTYVYNQENNVSAQSPVRVIPEKCATANTNTSKIFCASSDNIKESDLPDLWYKGKVTYADDLWRADTDSGGMAYLFNVKSGSGRELDMVNLVTNKDDSNLYFTNKTDGFLWMFELIPADENRQ